MSSSDSSKNRHSSTPTPGSATVTCITSCSTTSSTPTMPGTILRRIEEAKGVDGREPARCPFSTHYVPRFDAFRALAESVQPVWPTRTWRMRRSWNASASTPDEGRTDAGWSRLESGERQVAVDYSGIALNHLIRYRLACEIRRTRDGRARPLLRHRLRHVPSRHRDRSAAGRRGRLLRGSDQVRPRVLVGRGHRVCLRLGRVVRDGRGDV